MSDRDPMTEVIPLTQGYSAIVDAADGESVRRFRWCVLVRKGKPYAVRNVVRPDGKRRLLYLHTFLTGYGITDHINGDGLDNRRCNLRDATKEQNNRNVRMPRTNTSGYKGVTWSKASRAWQAQIHTNNRTKYLGTFPTKEMAAKAYDASARTLYGEFATLNFPLPGEMSARKAESIARGDTK